MICLKVVVALAAMGQLELQGLLGLEELPEQLGLEHKEQLVQLV
jgi:hypothetical protein